MSPTFVADGASCTFLPNNEATFELARTCALALDRRRLVLRIVDRGSLVLRGLRNVLFGLCLVFLLLRLPAELLHETGELLAMGHQVCIGALLRDASVLPAKAYQVFARGRRSIKNARRTSSV